MPEPHRPILRDWWERSGRPAAGLVFPARRGEHAGTGAKRGVSHAEAFRRDLQRVFGLEAWEAKGCLWPRVDRPLSARERELFEDTEFTKPVDFHSWRRAYSQALADADVSAQQAQALAGHASLDAHQRCLTNTAQRRSLPIGAIPRLRVSPRGLPKLIASKRRTPPLPTAKSA